MSTNTILLDFSVEPCILDGTGTKELVKQVTDILESSLGSGPLTPLISVSDITTGSETDRGTISLFLGPRGSTLTIRVYADAGLVTINLDYYLREKESPLINLEECRKLEAAWSALGRKVKTTKTLPVVRRGMPFDTYFYSSDERLLEYDIDRVLYDERSEFQHIQIVHSVNFGNLLVLDDLQNMAESDLINTESIMCRGVENYNGKEILILGGGDGAILYELLKENPKMIKMIEIDDMVMQACRIHLRSVCGDTLDNYKGNNYEIIVGDCVEYMTNCIVEGIKFDYVFADLTDIPISQTPQGQMWNFIKIILSLSFQTLKSTGKYMTHGNGSSSPGALKMFEDVLETLDDPVTFTRTHAFVPSFMENWVFYQIQRKPAAEQ